MSSTRAELALQELDAIRARIDAHRPLSRQQVDRVQTLVVPEFLWASAALGTREPLSLMETRAFLEREVVSGGHPLALFLELQRHQAAMETIKQRAREGGGLDVSFVRTLHQRLLAGARGDDVRPGQWKRSASAPTRWRGTTFEYAAPEEVPALMDQLLRGFADRQAQEHPLGAATWLYFHFHLIHPFEGLNGHVSRLLVTAALTATGYPPLVIRPEELSEYLDALTACSNTVPRGECLPLADKVDLTPLLELFARCLRRTAEQILDAVEGRELTPAELAPAVEESQASALQHLLGSPEASWRVRAGLEVKRLHERLEDLARQLVCGGPIYRVVLREHGVLPTHQLVLSELGSKLPTGDAGVMGQVVLAIEPEPTAAGVRFPAGQRLQVLVAAVQLGTQLLLHWSGDAEVEIHHGPPEAGAWSQVELERALTRSVDRRRRAYEMLLLDQNIGPGEALGLIREQLRTRRAARPPRSTPTGASGTTQRVTTITPRPTVRQALAPTPPPPERPVRPRRDTTSLQGLGLAPSEPPLSF